MMICVASQPMWSAIEELSPEVWLWIGDAVYVDKHSDGGVDKVWERPGFRHVRNVRNVLST